MIFSGLLVISVIGYALGNPSCPTGKDGMVNVHLICHTHDDVGWLKTADQYYYGAKKKVTWVGVQYILDSVVDSLLRDPTRKFIYVESAFFFRWWNEQNDLMKKKVKGLVRSGQLEFVGGGWCMNDEAAAHYNSIIDQMTVGLALLNETFGPEGVPRVAWQIDPFGHSREQASLFAQMGFDGLFLGRIDYGDKTLRLKSKEMEMVWEASDSLGKEASIFTGILPNTYSPPKGFCFDLLCADDPIMDDPRLEDYNVNEKVEAFLKLVKQQSLGYKTSHLIMTMGEDFNYVNAESWYKNLDKLIKYVNGRQSKGSKVNLLYSTPSCYLDDLHRANISWPSKTDDFFPYASDPHAFWTGYFTSRPSFKGYVRQGNNLLQVAKQVAILSGKHKDNKLEDFAEIMGVVQHHDAVSGTAKQHVTDDYYRQMATGIDEGLYGLAANLRKLVANESYSPQVRDFHFCPLLNVSACFFTETSQDFIVTIYNPIAKTRNHYVRIPVAKDATYKVIDSEGHAVKIQLVPVSEAVLRIPGRNSTAKYEIVFLAEQLPPLGVAQFWVQESSSRSSRGEQVSYRIPFNGDEDLVLDSKPLRVTLNKQTGTISHIGLSGQRLHNDFKIKQSWMWYAGMKGDNEQSDRRASGAYIFRNDGDARPVNKKSTPIVRVTGGDVVVEVEQEWAPWLVQTSRVYSGQNFVENDWLVGPLPIADDLGKEIISRYDVGDLKSASSFYTDANGREMLKRIKDIRPTWSLNKTEPVSQNYYPVNSRIILKDETSSEGFGVLVDRSQGGTSLSEGQIELMVHRRLLHDDAFGVGEALNETAYGEGLVVRGKHYLIHSKLSSPDCDFVCQHRTLGEELLLQPLVVFSPAKESGMTWARSPMVKKSGLSGELPPNVHLLTLEPWTHDRVLLRLEHLYELGESATFSSPAVVDVKDLFADWDVTEMREVTLGANQWKSDVTEFEWKTTKTRGDSNNINDHDNCINGDAVVTLSPMQIKSFLIKLVEKKSN